MPTTSSPRPRPVIKRALLITPGVPGLKFKSVFPTVTANMVPSKDALEGHELNVCRLCPLDTGAIDRLVKLKITSASEIKMVEIFLDLLMNIVPLLNGARVGPPTRDASGRQECRRISAKTHTDPVICS